MTAAPIDAEAVVGDWDPRTGTFAISAEQAAATASQRLARIRERQRLQRSAADAAVAAGIVQIIPARRSWRSRLSRWLARRS
ncbi:hypothetical protein [Brevundimonas bacteroides]|uniref:hypothetical protein n=1 Tax=Brevundimonas bacteroides TaxID=74311 RepID=UPI000497AEF5|nr:hypothetical protein [Brevundimonas bacteroides]